MKRTTRSTRLLFPVRLSEGAIRSRPNRFVMLVELEGRVESWQIDMSIDDSGVSLTRHFRLDGAPSERPDWTAGILPYSCDGIAVIYLTYLG